MMGMLSMPVLFTESKNVNDSENKKGIAKILPHDVIFKNCLKTLANSYLTLCKDVILTLF